MLRPPHYKREPRKIRRTSISLPDLTVAPASPRKSTYKQLCEDAEKEFLKTEYEKALVLYHRALKERPNYTEAKTGVRRCQESLNTILIKPIEKMSMTRCNSKATSRASRRSRRSSKPGTARYSLFEWANDLIYTIKEEDPFDPTVDMRHDAIHVFKLRNNQTYMKGIYDQLTRSAALKGDDDIMKILQKEMKYVSTRGYFWRNQIPIPTVPKLFKVKEKEAVVEEEPQMTSEEATRIVTEQLNKVLDAHQHGRHAEATDLGKECIEVIDRISALDVEYKDEVLGTVYSIIGNSYFEMDEVAESIVWHEKDLKFARKRYLENAESRALGNLGRSYAKKGDFEKAIELWTEKVPLCSGDSEKAWLYHEMGYCYLTMNNLSMANQCGIMSYEAAEKASDYDWMQNSCILIAQANVALGFLQNALETYNQALYLCDLTGNDEMRENIHMAMGQISAHMEETGQTIDTQDNQETLPSRGHSQASFHSAQSELVISSDNASRSSSLSLRGKQNEKRGSPQSRHLRRDASFTSQVSNSGSETDRTVIKPNRKAKKILKSATTTSFEESSRIYSKSPDNKFKSKSHVSFVLPTNSSRLSSREKAITPIEQETTIELDRENSNKQRRASKETPAESTALPSINDTALVAQPVTSKPSTPNSTQNTELSNNDNDTKQDSAENSDNFFDDTNDDAVPNNNTQTMSSEAFYLNTSRVLSGKPYQQRTASAHSRAESIASTDPRNALSESEDVLSNDLQRSRESWSRHSRRSVISNS